MNEKRHHSVALYNRGLSIVTLLHKAKKDVSKSWSGAKMQLKSLLCTLHFKVK